MHELDPIDESWRLRRQKRRERDAEHVRQKQADDHAEINGGDRVELLAANGHVGDQHADRHDQSTPRKRGPRQPASCLRAFGLRQAESQCDRHGKKTQRKIASHNDIRTKVRPGAAAPARLLRDANAAENVSHSTNAGMRKATSAGVLSRPLRESDGDVLRARSDRSCRPDNRRRLAAGRRSRREPAKLGRQPLRARRQATSNISRDACRAAAADRFARSDGDTRCRTGIARGPAFARPAPATGRRAQAPAHVAAPMRFRALSDHALDAAHKSSTCQSISSCTIARRSWRSSSWRHSARARARAASRHSGTSQQLVESQASPAPMHRRRRARRRRCCRPHRRPALRAAGSLPLPPSCRCVATALPALRATD